MYKSPDYGRNASFITKTICGLVRCEQTEYVCNNIVRIWILVSLTSSPVQFIA